MSLYPNIIPHFAENFQWTIFKFTETPCTISRSGDDRDCLIIFHWKQGYLKVNVRQLSYYVNFSFFLWNLVKKRTFCQKGRPLKKKGQNVSFTELKDEKGRIDSLDDVDRQNKTKKNKTNKTKQNKTISTPWPFPIGWTFVQFLIYVQLLVGSYLHNTANRHFHS